MTEHKSCSFQRLRRSSTTAMPSFVARLPPTRPPNTRRGVGTACCPTCHHGHGPSTFTGAHLGHDKKGDDARRVRGLGCGGTTPWDPRLRPPPRWVFRDRGDVWRLARSIGQALESRTWPSTDRPKVERLVAFVHTVTGRKPVAFFADTLPSAAALPATKSLPARVLGVGGRLFFVRWLRVMYVGLHGGLRVVCGVTWTL